MNEKFKDHIVKALNKNVRMDGRKKDDFRKITIETGVTCNAEGSARVICGETEVIAGIKMAVGTPYPDKSDEGILMTGVELYPMSNPDFEGGPPREDAIEIARVIDRGVRESGMIDTKKLCITPGEAVWMVNLDIAPINMDGNLIDIGTIAALAALKDAKMPELKNGKPDYKNLSKNPLPVSKNPIEVTVLKIGENLLVDPTQSEEKLLDARLTVSVLENSDICAMQKGGNSPLTDKDILEMVDLAIKKSKELRKLL
ncbi:RNA-binding protein [Candidatus Woesearchaeota archaeon]|jgi:exosome complex component RRP42|nr:RNA-binding protein [Candidatus Woesearchaeota archaeon]|tara:strand:- start:2084 stop:2854 length:771 start_codon:yes stop_codon:yes gene_type:complete